MGSAIPISPVVLRALVQEVASDPSSPRNLELKSAIRELLAQPLSSWHTPTVEFLGTDKEALATFEDLVRQECSSLTVSTETGSRVLRAIFLPLYLECPGHNTEALFHRPWRFRNALEREIEVVNGWSFLTFRLSEVPLFAQQIHALTPVDVQSLALNLYMDGSMGALAPLNPEGQDKFDLVWVGILNQKEQAPFKPKPLGRRRQGHVRCEQILENGLSDFGLPCLVHLAKLPHP